MAFSYAALSTWTLVAAAYAALIQCLRFHRTRKIEAQFETAPALRSMTLEEAYEIQRDLMTLEFPTTFSNSSFFALFKTYGMPSISSLLLQTAQLSDTATASKRAADTGVILAEVLLHPPSSVRAMEAIGRMNYLHSLYRRSGKISDNDMLYTLSLFALEPMRWVKRFEWRHLTLVELCAIGTYWRYMADAMDIPLTALTPAADWTHGADFLHDLETWSLRYEKDNMKQAETNRSVAAGTIAIALHNVPSALHGLALQFVAAVLEPHVARAMFIDEPPSWVVHLLSVVVTIRVLALRYLFLPRPGLFRVRWWSDDVNAHGKYNATQYFSLPWYVKPTLLARWGPKALLLRLVGVKLPGDDGERYHPDGYIIADIGPEKLCGKGRSEMQESIEHIRSSQGMLCPFGAPF